MLLKLLSSQSCNLIPVFGKKYDNEVLIANNFLHYEPLNEFLVIDSRHSAFWKVVDELSVFCEFEEPYFYENLCNDAPRECMLIDRYADFFMREYQSTLFLNGIAIADRFIECPHCGEVFQTKSYFGLVRCPSCYRLLNNPYSNHHMILQSPELLELNSMDKYRNCYYYQATGKYYKTPPNNIQGKGDIVY